MNDWNKRFFEKFEFEGLTFDDVSIIPQKSDVVPVDTDHTTWLSQHIKMNRPFASADMDTVTDGTMALEMAKLGGIGFIYKCEMKQQLDFVDIVKYAFNPKVPKPRYIHEDQRIEDIFAKLEKDDNRFSSLVVVDANNRVVGLITRHETERAELSDLVRDRMIKKAVTIDRDMEFQEAYDYMRRMNVGKLIQVNSEGELDGLYCWEDVKSIVMNMNPLYNLNSKGQLIVGANVGVIDDDDFTRVEELLRRGCDIILVGSAHAHSTKMIGTVDAIHSQFAERYPFDIIAGNIVSAQAALDLCNVGAAAVKVGIGAGSICTTRVVSGAGIPQVSATYQVRLGVNEYNSSSGKEPVRVMCDGGMKNSGDVPKAIVAGADTVMFGKIVAGADESPAPIIEWRGQQYKVYRGMASISALKASQASRERYKQRADKSVPEGIEGLVPLSGPLKRTISLFDGGFGSGMGYAGVRTTEELQKEGRFIRVLPAGQVESHPHDLEHVQDAPNYRAEQRR